MSFRKSPSTEIKYVSISLFQGDFNMDLNQITLGNMTMADPGPLKSHFEIPSYNMDEIQRILDECELSWLYNDTLR